MINTVLFDMGGTLEDIYIDDASKTASAAGVLRILQAHGIEPGLEIPEAIQQLAEGWDRYAAYRGPTNRELKPEEIWGNYILTSWGLDFETVRPFAEELAHMWEVTHYHRQLRPHVKEMLSGLQDMGMKLGEYGIRDFFRDVTLSSVTGYRKPDSNIFLVSLNQVRSSPAECAYVGDTYSRDVIGPQRLGFGATFHIHSFLTQSRDMDIPKDVRATYTIQDIYEVYTILKTRTERREEVC